MESKLTIIPKVRRVFRDTYANLPLTGLSEEDLGYATDRLVFYRWNGTAWEAVTIHSSSGTAANIPAAADLPNGSLYYETDTTLLKQVQSGVWVTIKAIASQVTFDTTQVYATVPPAAYTDLDLSAVVGSNQAVVLLKVHTNVARNFKFRKNGDTDNSFYDGAAGGILTAIGFLYFIVVTDAAGIVEWMADAAAGTATVTFEAYWK